MIGKIEPKVLSNHYDIEYDSKYEVEEMAEFVTNKDVEKNRFG